MNEKVQGIIDELYEKLPKDKILYVLVDEFRNIPTKEGLVGYHHTLGRWIRNEYKLWEIEWDPMIIDGVDYSPYHPDTVSQTIIEGLWKKIRSENQ